MMQTAIKKIPEGKFDLLRQQKYIDYSHPSSHTIQFMPHWKPRKEEMEEFVITERRELSEDYQFEIANKSYKIPQELKPVAKQIEEAREILTYEDDWDDEGAHATDIATFENAISFIIDYSIFIYDKTGSVLKTPYIDILRDGSVSVHWESDYAQLLIIFKKEKSELAYYYAEIKDSKVPLKSAIEPGKSVDEILALWMQMNLS